MICLLAQDNVFEECENSLLEFLGLEISAKQIQRVSEHYGGTLEEWEADYQEEKQEVPVVSKRTFSVCLCHG